MVFFYLVRFVPDDNKQRQGGEEGTRWARENSGGEGGARTGRATWLCRASLPLQVVMGAEDHRRIHDVFEPCISGAHEGDAMVVVPTFGGNPEEEIRVVIKDLDPKPRISLSLPSSTTVSQLYAQVSAKRQYPEASFELGIEDTVLGEEYQNATLASVRLSKGHGSYLKMVLTRSVEYQGPEHNHLFEKAAEDDNSFTSSSYDWKSTANDATSSKFTININEASLASRNSIHGGLNTAGGSTFAGLSNQGATCYMNSLLQSLFMTPEFRAGVYKIPVETDVEKQKDSICFQLQSLFASMQLSKKSSVETKGLTQSFGWTGSEAFQQHDVQELCRVLFDELESRLKGTPEETLIKDMFEGTMESYVRNMPGGALEFESSKSEAFLDISLSIREFGNPRPISTLAEGLENFVKPEKLDGANQYQVLLKKNPKP